MEELKKEKLLVNTLNCFVALNIQTFRMIKHYDNRIVNKPFGFIFDDFINYDSPRWNKTTAAASRQFDEDHWIFTFKNLFDWIDLCKISVDIEGNESDFINKFSPLEIFRQEIKQLRNMRMHIIDYMNGNGDNQRKFKRKTEFGVSSEDKRIITADASWLIQVGSQIMICNRVDFWKAKEAIIQIWRLMRDDEIGKSAWMYYPDFYFVDLFVFEKNNNWDKDALERF